MLKNLLRQKESAIRGRWLEEIFQAYAPEARASFKQGKDPFENPVGHTLSTEIGAVLTLLIDAAGIAESSELSQHLENILKIKAVQEFTPSQAISFVYLLKGVVRAELKSELKLDRIASELMGELISFEDRLDALALRAFDIYMKYRETIYELRVNEVKRRISKRLAGVCSPEIDPEVDPV